MNKSLILINYLILIMFLGLHAQIPTFTINNGGDIYSSTGAHLSSSVLDIDNDGDMDLVITNTSFYNNATYKPNLMYKNERNTIFKQIFGTPYTDTISDVGFPGPYGDIDNDGDTDAAGWGLFWNDGFGCFKKGASIGTYGFMMDLNNDKFLDFVGFSTNYGYTMFFDPASMTFKTLGTNGLVPNSKSPNAMIQANCSFGDADNDGDFDLYLPYSDFSSPYNGAYNQFYLYNGSNTYKLQSDTLGILKDAAMTPSCNWVDYDNDGDMDLYVLNTWNIANSAKSVSGGLFENMGNLVFQKHIIEPPIYRDAHRVSSQWADLDNDGDQDLMITVEKNTFWNHLSSVSHNLVLVNNGDKTFTELTNNTLVNESSHTLNIEDYDNDGFQDVLLVRYSWSSDGRNIICKNSGNSNSWATFNLEGRNCNRSAFGTRVIAKTTIGGKYISQVREITPLNGHGTFGTTRVHFGLGNAQKIDSLIVCWASGHKDTIIDIKAKQFYHIVENQSIQVEYKATSYIKYNTIPAEELNIDCRDSINLKQYFQFEKGDTLPVIVGDTLNFSVYENKNPDLVEVSIEKNYLKLKALKDGTAQIKLLVSAGFTERLEILNSIVSCNTRINNKKNHQLIEIYPNPANQKIYIKYEGWVNDNLKYQIVDITGKIAKTSNLEQIIGDKEINISELQDGMYFIKIIINGVIIREKFIKANYK